jgi:hypothetical protein
LKEKNSKKKKGGQGRWKRRKKKLRKTRQETRYRRGDSFLGGGDESSVKKYNLGKTGASPTRVLHVHAQQTLLLPRKKKITKTK